MINQDNFDFSFSGLKTAVLNHVKHFKLMEQLAFQLQEAITDVLVTKTLNAAKKYQVKSILVGGGVAANNHLREKFQSTIEQSNNQTIKFFAPAKNLSTDNAASIASCAYFNYHPLPFLEIKPDPGLTIQ